MQTRQMGQAPQPISYSEIDAYSRLSGIRITPWELRVLRRLDAVAVDVLMPKRPDGAIPAQNGRGVASMMRGLAARKRKDRVEA